MDRTHVRPIDIVSDHAHPGFRDSLVGFRAATLLTVCLFAFMVYEYAITVDDEVKHFWKGPFKTTSLLFFYNRYIPLLINLMEILILFMPHPRLDVCRITVPVIFLLTLFSVGIIQAIIITRVWFLYPGSTTLRSIVIFTFVITGGISLAFVYISANQLDFIYVAGSNVVGCRVAKPPGFFKIFFPNLVLHTILYMLTLYQTLSNPKYRHARNLRTRLMKDGGIFYLVVLSSVTITAVGSFGPDKPRINILAIYCPIMLSTTSVAASRITFRLRATTQAMKERADTPFEWVSTIRRKTAPSENDPFNGAWVLTERGVRQGSPTTLQTSRYVSNASPLSRFSADSDAFSLRPALVSPRNRLVVPYGSPNDETGLRQTTNRERSMAFSLTEHKQGNGAVPLEDRMELGLSLQFPAGAFLRKREEIRRQ